MDESGKENGQVVKRYRFVVVGGGIVGTSLAYALSCLGRRTLLVEKDFVASGCTGLSAGTIACAGLGNGKDPDLTASHHTREMLRCLTNEGWDAGYEETGALQLALNEKEKVYMKNKYTWLLLNQYTAQFLHDYSSVKSIEPAISEVCKAALLLPLSGHVDPQLASQAFADAAAARGAKILEQTEATCISDEATNTSGVVVSLSDKTERRKWDVVADHVIVATGGVPTSILPGPGKRVPKIVPVKGTIWLTSEPLPTSTLRHVIYIAESSKYWSENPNVSPPVTHDGHTGKKLVTHAYGKQMRDGRIMFGGDRIPITSESKVAGSEADRVRAHIDYVGSFLPVVKSAKEHPNGVTDSWTGVMPFSGHGYRHVCTKLSDRVHFLGGFGSHGVMHGPGYAKMFVDSVVGNTE